MRTVAKRILLLLGLLFLLPAVAGAVAPAALGLDFADLGVTDPTIVQDVKYATPANFAGQVLYPSARCLLRSPVAKRLERVQRDLQAQGLGLKVFDCYRPLTVQKKLWAILPDENYVANPAAGSRHNRGASVDVGLVDAAGRELPMPSAFDEFSERSHLAYTAAEPEQLRNRQILQNAMNKAGFLSVTTEWWHFDSPDWRDYDLSDLDIRLIPAGASQVLAVSEPRPGTASAVLWGLERRSGGWTKVLGPVAVNVGRNGIAGFDQKREGDGMTPRGVYRLGTVFGYADSVPTRMPYRQATLQDVWIDEPASPRYNQWVRGIPAKESHEKMRRSDDLYRLGVVVEYNTSPVVAGKGSAIFLHIWRGLGQPTAGCVAMDDKALEQIIAWLDPVQSPQIIIGYPNEQ